MTGNNTTANAPRLSPASPDGMKVLFLALAGEGLLSVSAGLAVRSMARRAVLFGLSPARLAVAAGFFALVLLFALLAAWSFLRPAAFQKLYVRLLGGLLARPARCLGLLFGLLYATLTGGALFLLLVSPYMPASFYPAYVGLARFFLACLWVVSTPAQLGAILLVGYGRALRQALPRAELYRQAVGFVCAFLVSLYWLTLALEANWMSALPGWFWYFVPSSQFSPALFFLLAAGGLVLLGALFLLRNPRRAAAPLLLLVGLAYAVQVLFGFAAGDGFRSIQQRFLYAGKSDEVRYVCTSQAALLPTITQYDALYGATMWYGTKPPGEAAFYTLLRQAVQAVRPGLARNPQACVEAVARAASYFLPLLAALTLLLVYGLERLLEANANPFLSGLLVLLAPDFLMFLLYPDQFLLPLLFALAACATGLALRRKSFWSGLLVGFLLYAIPFVSFSMLPAVGLVGFWVVLDRLFSREAPEDARLAWLVLGILAGAAVMWAGGLFLLKYDPIARFTAAFSSHRALKDYVFSVPNLFQYALLNNVEFSFWAGAPLYVLALAGSAGALLSLRRRKAGRFEIFAAAFLLTYLVTNVAGQTRGEVGRMWLFLLPPAAVIAVREAARIFKSAARGALLLYALQFVSACLIYFAFTWR